MNILNLIPTIQPFFHKQTNYFCLFQSQQEVVGVLADPGMYWSLLVEADKVLAKLGRLRLVERE
jgi:hypothetical protein